MGQWVAVKSPFSILECNVENWKKNSQEVGIEAII
jgi:hypothetical protein